MKFKIRQRFDLHVCFDEPESTEVIAFDINHRWKLPECHEILSGDNTVLRMESNRCRENYDLVGFNLHYQWDRSRVWFGDRKNKNRFRFAGGGVGGNMCWEIICFDLKTSPHVLNWLRRQTGYGKSEWQTDFESIWHSRRSLTSAMLADWGKSQIRLTLKIEAALANCSVEELIRRAMTNPVPQV